MVIAESAAFASVVKVLVDLVSRLDADLTDRRTRELFLPVKEQTLAVREAYLQLQTQQLQQEHRHAEEKRHLADEHSKAMSALAHENAQIKLQLDEANAKLRLADQKPKASFSQRTGTWTDGGIHYCPKCWQQDKHSPMQAVPHYWICRPCDSFFVNPDNPPPPRPSIECVPFEAR